MSTRTRKPGFTLVELLVACTVFLGIAVTMVLIERMARSSQAKTDVKSDAYRMTTLAVEHIKMELRGARVLAVTPGELDYTPPRLEDGAVALDSEGNPIWDAQRAIFLKDGQVLCENQDTNEARVLGTLGQGGSLAFANLSLAGLDWISLSVRSQVDSEHPESYATTVRIYLPNRG